MIKVQNFLHRSSETAPSFLEKNILKKKKKKLCLVRDQTASCWDGSFEQKIISFFEVISKWVFVTNHVDASNWSKIFVFSFIFKIKIIVGRSQSL